MNNIFCKLLTSSLLLTSISVDALDIIVGPGQGIVWSGSPYSFNVSGVQGGGLHWYGIGIGYIYTTGNCQEPKQMTKLPEGFSGYKITTGIYLVPRAVVTGQLFYGPNTSNLDGAYNHIFSGTLGYPETKVVDSTGAEFPRDTSWCLITPWIYAKEGEKKEMSVSGDWIIYADGTQIPSETIFQSPQLKGSLWSAVGPTAPLDTGENYLNKVLVSGLTIKVVGVVCTVSTQTNINFNEAVYDARPDTEIASVTSPFSVSCKQGALPTTVNINASFRANTGIFNGNKTQLSLTQGGGYITGEIGRGVTGSGECAAHPSSLSFAQEPLNLTKLLSTSPSVDYSNTITWRLCSGGNDLPVGNVSASTELSIVFS